MEQPSSDQEIRWDFADSVAADADGYVSAEVETL